jgi:hypothetical protein
MSTLKPKEDLPEQTERNYCGCGRATHTSSSICYSCEARLLLAKHQEHLMGTGVIKTELFGRTSKILGDGKVGLNDETL